MICYPTLLLLSSLILVFFCIFRASLISSVGKESTFNAGDPGSPPGLGGSLGEGIGYPLQYSWAFLVAQLVKNPPAMQETWVQSLGWEDPLEKGKATHFSILAWSYKESDMTKQRSLHFIYSSVFYIDGHVIKQIYLFLSKPNCCLIAVARTCRPCIVLDIKGEVFSLSPLRSLFMWWFSCEIVSALATPWTVACQAPLSMGFSRQEYWSGLPFPSPSFFCRRL